VVIEVSPATSKAGHPLQAWFGDKPAHIVAATGRRSLVLVPELNNGAEIEVSVDENGKSAKPARFITGRKLTGDIHPVANPAFDPQGEMFVGDRSGKIYRVNEIGAAEPWAELEPSVSAYHLACGPDDALYVTGPTVSSFDSITRFDEDGRGTVFYRGLGRPQGLAFDRDGNLYVAASLRGRRGIVRILPDGGDADIFVAGMNLVGLA